MIMLSRSPLFCTGALLLGLAMGAPGQCLADDITASRRAELVRLVRQDCGSCHGLRLTGGLGSPLTARALVARGLSEETLEATILHGRPGTAMPAWKSLLSEAEARWIAEQLLHGFSEEP